MGQKESNLSDLSEVSLFTLASSGKEGNFLNSFNLSSDQDRISPYNINHISDENKEIYQVRDHYLIQY